MQIRVLTLRHSHYNRATDKEIIIPMHAKRSIICTLILFLSCWMVHDLGAYPLQSISFDGLKRTKEEVVRNLIPLHIGQEVDGTAVEQARQALEKSGLFSTIEIGVSEDQANKRSMLTVLLKEKWTLIPIPFLAVNDSGVRRGLFLLESNLLGYGKFLMTAAYGGADGLNSLIIYSDPALAGSRWTGSIVGNIGVDDSHIRLADGTTVRSYDSRFQQVTMKLGYHLTHSWLMEGRLRWRRWEIENFTGGIDTTPIPSGMYVEPELMISFDETTPLGPLSIGTLSSLTARYNSLEHGWEASAMIDVGIPIAQRHRIRLLLSAGYGEMSIPAQRQISAQDGFRTLPYKGVTADEWASIAAYADIHAIHGSWGSLVLSHYWELGTWCTESIRGQPFYGPGAGLRLFMRKIAVPAMGVDLAYNIADPSWIFSFTIEMEM